MVLKQLNIHMQKKKKEKKRKRKKSRHRPYSLHKNYHRPKCKMQNCKTPRR